MPTSPETTVRKLLRIAVPFVCALAFGLTACSDDDPVAVVVEEEQPFDSVPTGCVLDTIPGTGHTRLICP